MHVVSFVSTEQDTIEFQELEVINFFCFKRESVDRYLFQFVHTPGPLNNTLHTKDYVPFFSNSKLIEPEKYCGEILKIWNEIIPQIKKLYHIQILHEIATYRNDCITDQVSRYPRKKDQNRNKYQWEGHSAPITL